jgi:glycosyltransferase involved in cell wall biosynthesis
MIKILFLIRALDQGGAERQLIELVKGLDKTHFEITLATFYDGGALRPEIEGIAGVTVVSLHKKSRWDLEPFLWRLTRLIFKVRPQIIHGYLGIANELGLALAKAAGAKSVWGLRSSNMDASHYDWLAALSFRVGAWLSRYADLIIVNSFSGRNHHIRQGYCGKRMVVIHNGINTDRFQPDYHAGRRQRSHWNLAEGQPLIGIVGRLDPMKDHPTFLRAAALLSDSRPDVRFVCVGDGPAPYKEGLYRLAEELGLGSRLIWAGPSSDLRAIYNALDIATSSSSFGEGFSNVTGEAMACGVACVVTDVGDSRLIVGDPRQAVPPGRPAALVKIWAELLDLPESEKAALSQAARERIETSYNLEKLISKTEGCLADLVEQGNLETVKDSSSYYRP